MKKSYNSLSKQRLTTQLRQQRIGAKPCGLRRCVQIRSSVDDDSVESLSKEFDNFSSKDRYIEQYKQLELRWKVEQMQSLQPEQCSCCSGSKEVPCEFCGSTGFLMLGESLVCSVQGQTTCVVCNGSGYVNCKECQGTGYKAAWADISRMKDSQNQK